MYFQLVFAFWSVKYTFPAKIQNGKHRFFVTLVIYLHIDISKNLPPWPIELTPLAPGLIYDLLGRNNKYIHKIVTPYKNIPKTWNCHAKLLFQLIIWHTYNLQTRFAWKMTDFLKFLSNNLFEIYALLLKPSHWYFLFSWHIQLKFSEKQKLTVWYYRPVTEVTYCKKNLFSC